MKLLDFVQRHPSHAKWAICILSIGFAASFSALLALGLSVCHVRCVEKNTNAALVISDVLALYSIRENGQEGEAVYRALVDARAPLCLTRGEVQMLTEAITANGNSFDALCTMLQSVVKEERCTASVLSAAIQQNVSENKPSSASETIEAGTVASYRRFKLYDTEKLAETFFGVPFVFRTSGNLSYCANLCARFNDKNGKLTAFSAEWQTGHDDKLSKEECGRRAVLFAEERVGLRSVTAEEARIADGVCWTEITDYNGLHWKIGVCTDTGRVCFFCSMQSESTG